MTAPQQVWVVLYLHKHGEDVFVASTCTNAYRWVAETIREWAESEDETGQHLATRAQEAQERLARWLTGQSSDYGHDAFGADMSAIADEWREATNEIFTVDSYVVDQGL